MAIDVKLGLSSKFSPLYSASCQFENGKAGLQRKEPLGFGEVNDQEQIEKQKSLEKRIRIAVCTSLGLLVASLSAVSLGLSLSVRIGAMAVCSMSGGLGLCLFLLSILPVALIYLEKKSKVPPTNSFGLNDAYPQVPALNTFTNRQSVILCENGEKSAFWKIECLKNAEQSIEISGNFCGGPSFHAALEMLQSKMTQNKILKVHLISSKDLLPTEDLETMQRLQTAFPERFHFIISDRKLDFNPGINCTENHVKMIIVDGKYVVIGGSNFKDTFNVKGDGSEPYSETNFIKPKELFVINSWRDHDVVIRGNIAETLRLEFFKLYAVHSLKMGYDRKMTNQYFPLDPNLQAGAVRAFDEAEEKFDDVEVKAIAGSPRSSENAITNEYCRILDSAQRWERIYIGQMLFNPCPKLYHSLAGAVARGVRIEVISNSINFKNIALSEFYIWPNRLNYYPLMRLAPRKNVKFYEYTIPGTMYHSKSWAAGDQTIFSSYNFGRKSHDSDDEIAVVIRSAKVAKKFNEIFEEDKQLSKKIKEADAKKWRGIKGLPGRIENTFFTKFFG